MLQVSPTCRICFEKMSANFVIPLCMKPEADALISLSDFGITYETKLNFLLTDLRIIQSIRNR